MTGGGTAGHITPLLAVAKELINLSGGDVELYFIGQKGDKNTELIEASGLPITRYFISAGKFRRYHNENLFHKLFDVKTNFYNLRDVFRVIRGYFSAKRILKDINADVLFAKGGFVVVPVGRAASRLKIPYITHDSDAIPGLANRLIASGAVKHAVAHKGVTAYPADKSFISGIPLSSEYTKRSRVDQREYKKILGIPEDALLIFVYAGTQGARVIDEALESVAPSLLEKYKNLHIAHVFGRLNEQAMASQYSGVGESGAVRIHKMAFVDNAFDYIAAADLIIGRAGATSTAEFAAVGRACIIVPADQLTGGHQLKNAEVFEKEGAIVVVRESELPTKLRPACEELLDSAEKRHLLEETIHAFAMPDSAQLLASLILKQVRTH